jgi:hypothetical protein
MICNCCGSIIIRNQDYFDINDISVCSNCLKKNGNNFFKEDERVSLPIV